MKKSFKRPLVFRDAYIDTLVLRAPKYVHDAHLTDIFEVEHIPYEFLSKTLRLKSVKRLQIHKIHSTNFPQLRTLLKRHSKGLQDMIHHGLEHRKKVENLKKLVWHAREFVLTTEDIIQWKNFIFQRSLENLSINISANDGALKNVQLKALASKTMHLKNLKALHIQGDCGVTFEKIFLALEKVLSSQKSLHRITLAAVKGMLTQDCQEKVPGTQLFSRITEVKTTLEAENKLLRSFLDNSRYLGKLVSLTGVVQPDFSISLQNLADFRNLRQLSLFFYQTDLGLLKNCLSLKFYPRTLESLDLNFSCIQDSILSQLQRESQASDLDSNVDYLPNLISLKLTMPIAPCFKPEDVEPFFDLAKTRNLKELSLKCDNFENKESLARQYPFTALCLPLKERLLNLVKLNLIMPHISFEGVSEGLCLVPCLEEFKLESHKGVEGIGSLGNFLMGMDPKKVACIEIGKQIIGKSEDFVKELSVIKSFSGLRKLKLTGIQHQKGSLVDSEVVDLLDCLKSLQYIYLNYATVDSIGKDAKQEIQKRVTSILQEEGFAYIGFQKLEN